jgi:hypothetical protein
MEETMKAQDLEYEEGEEIRIVQYESEPLKGYLGKSGRDFSKEGGYVVATHP